MIILDAFVSFLLIAAFSVSAFIETRDGYRSKFIGFIICLVGAIGYAISIFAKKFELILAYSGLGTIIIGGIYILIFNDFEKLRKEKAKEYITPFKK